jgi:hypothetical protein
MVRALWLLWLLGCGNVEASRDAGADAPADAPADASQITEGLIAWYRMDVVANGAVADAAGHHDGACVAMACPGLTGNGRVDGAYLFDGKDELVRVPFAPELNTTTGFTITAWINRNQAGGAGCFVNKIVGDSDANSWQACVSDAAPLTFYSTDANGTHSQPSIALDVGRWYHIALRWDGSTKATYVDGQLEALHAGISIQFDLNDVAIGGDLDKHAPAAWFDGRIDDVRIYNRALSMDELAALQHP